MGFRATEKHIQDQTTVAEVGQSQGVLILVQEWKDRLHTP